MELRQRPDRGDQVYQTDRRRQSGGGHLHDVHAGPAAARRLHGGLRWNTTSGYKNAITSELFLTLAALLHQRTPGEQGGYLTWAQRAWEAAALT